MDRPDAPPDAARAAGAARAAAGPELGAELPDAEGSVELVRRAQAGDAAAVEELFRRYQERLYRIARIRMGARLRRHLESADIVQNTYAVAFQRIRGFELRSHAGILQWLARILENQVRDAADHFGAQKRDGATVPLAPPGRSEEARAPDPPATDPSPSEVTAGAELREIYDACVEGLEGDLREVVLLREYAGAPWDFIARELARPTAQSVQELYRRARIKLAASLARRLRR